MSYDKVKSGLVAVLNAQSLAESKEAVDFNNASAEEHEHTFILSRLGGQEDPENERQQAFLYDDQKWQIQVAYSKSSESQVVQRDRLQELADILIQKFDNPANWNTYCTILRYKSWTIKEVKSYFVLSIQLKIIDALTYS